MSRVSPSQPNNAESTPTPWELIEATEHHGAYIVNSWGRTVCDLYAMSNPLAASVRNGGTSFPVPFDDMAANAAFIVEAVNSHAALVKALDDLVKECVNPGDGGPFEAGEWPALDRARAALSHRSAKT